MVDDNYLTNKVFSHTIIHHLSCNEATRFQKCRERQRRKNKMGSLIIDGSGYSDLINNFNTFHTHYSEDELLDIKGKWEDDSDYSNYRELEDLVKNATPEDYEKSHVVSVWIHTFSVVKKHWVVVTVHFGLSQIVVLRRHNFLVSIVKGKYRQSAAGVMSGMLRPHPTLLDHWVLVKFIGNNRVVKKLLANCW